MGRVVRAVTLTLDVAVVGLLAAGAVGVWLAWWPAGCLLSGVLLGGVSWRLSR